MNLVIYRLPNDVILVAVAVVIKVFLMLLLVRYILKKKKKKKKFLSLFRRAFRASLYCVEVIFIPNFDILCPETSSSRTYLSIQISATEQFSRDNLWPRETWAMGDD